jgi:hypothetical protein
MPKYLYLNAPDQRWELPEDSDIKAVEGAVAPATRRGAHRPALGPVVIDVIIEGQRTPLHIDVDSVRSVAVVDLPAEAFAEVV